MRISDWSSDVCSSDLLKGVADQLVVMLSAKKEQLETGSDPHKIEWIRLATDLADPRLQERDLKRRPRRAQRLDHVREAISGPFGVESRSGCRSDPNRVRSEEHTSELQSLMRISYAVFC